MNATLQPPSPTTAAPQEIALLPAEAFFVRRIDLDPASAPAQQAELALEAGAPFGVDQLYYGFLRAPDAKSALIFATHRRLFAGDEWLRSTAVLPAFAALLGDPPAGSRIRLWQEGERFTAAAWDGTGPLPAVVISQIVGPAGDDAARTSLLTEVQRRLGADADVEEFSGPVQTNTGRKRQEIELSVEARSSGRRVTITLDRAAIESMDVRDKTVLATRRQAQLRDRVLWIGFAGSLAGIALAVVLELANVGGGLLLKKQRAAQDEVAVAVRKIEIAQTLSARIEEMGQRRLQPLEMMAAINAPRPDGIQFTRASTSGQNTLEIEAQTSNAGSVGVYETALRALPALAKVEIRDLRLREGVTTFQLSVTFKPGALSAGGKP